MQGHDVDLEPRAKSKPPPALLRVTLHATGTGAPVNFVAGGRITTRAGALLHKRALFLSLFFGGETVHFCQMHLESLIIPLLEILAAGPPPTGGLFRFQMRFCVRIK